MKKQVTVIVVFMFCALNAFGQSQDFIDRYADLKNKSENQQKIIERLQSDSLKFEEFKKVITNKVVVSEQKLKDYEEIKEQLDEMEKALKKSNEDLEDANRKYSKAEEEIKEFEEKEKKWDNGELKKENEELEKLKNKAIQDAAGFKKESDAKSESIESMNREIIERDTKITELTNEINTLETQKGDAEKFVSKYEEGVEKLKKKEATITDLRSKLQKYNGFLDKELQTLEGEINEFVGGTNFDINDKRIKDLSLKVNTYLVDFPDNKKLKELNSKMRGHESVSIKISKAKKNVSAALNPDLVKESMEDMESLFKNKNGKIISIAKELFDDLEAYCNYYKNIRIEIINLKKNYRSDRKRKEVIDDLLKQVKKYSHLEKALKLKKDNLDEEGSGILNKVNCN